jgi:hypothetical protein
MLAFVFPAQFFLSIIRQSRASVRFQRTLQSRQAHFAS